MILWCKYDYNNSHFKDEEIEQLSRATGENHLAGTILIQALV